jgi:hypothetical protein
MREVIVDGASDIVTCCAACGSDMGDSKELVIPKGVQDLFKALVQRCTFKVDHFELKEHVGHDSITMSNRAEPNARLVLDWRPLEPKDEVKSADVPSFQTVDLPERKLKVLPPILQTTAKMLQHHGCAVIEANVAEVDDPSVRMKNGRLDACIRFRGTTHVTTYAGRGLPIETNLLVRIQLTWCKNVCEDLPKLDLEILFKHRPDLARKKGKNQV